MANSPEAIQFEGISVKEAADFEHCSQRTINTRIKTPADPKYLASALVPQPNGRLERRINPLSMTPMAQERWRTHELAKLAPKPPANIPNEHGQLSLLPRTKLDDEFAALHHLPESMREVVKVRLSVTSQIQNFNWKAANFQSKRAFLNHLAEVNHMSARSIQRLAKNHRESGSLMSLVPEIRGPERYTGSHLDADMRAHLQRAYVFEKMTVKQCYDSLIRYLTEKQNSPGCRASHLYKIPKYWTIARFIRSLGPLEIASRKGPETLKAACGYIDRTYRDLASLGRVEVDEWKCDFFAYDAKRPKNVRRWWLMIFYDAKSMFPLVGKLVTGSEHSPAHGIREADEIEILVRLLKEYGVPGGIYSDHGRFRGKTFGGHARRSEMFDGILDRLGIRKIEPREKNPRGSRLERFHRYLADQARTVPGWIGANDKQREMTRGDEQKALHERWTKGDPDVPRTPLLSNVEAMQKIEEWMNAWRDHDSEGTDMNGLSPRAVFAHGTPEGGFTKISDERIDWETAEHIPGELVETGGIIELRDGKRYSHPLLLTIQGERREVVRKRDDHSQIWVLPAAKGDETIIALRREPVGLNNPDNLARQMALQKRVQSLVGRTLKPLALIPEGFAPLEEAAAPPPAPHQEISGPEYLIEWRKSNARPKYTNEDADKILGALNDERKVKPVDFADLDLEG